MKFPPPIGYGSSIHSPSTSTLCSPRIHSFPSATLSTSPTSSCFEEIASPRSQSIFPQRPGSDERWSRTTARLSVKGAGAFARPRFLPICLSGLGETGLPKGMAKGKRAAVRATGHYSVRWNAFCSGLVVSGNGSADITRPGTPVVAIQGTGDLPWHPLDAVHTKPTPR